MVAVPAAINPSAVAICRLLGLCALSSKGAPHILVNASTNVCVWVFVSESTDIIIKGTLPVRQVNGSINRFCTLKLSTNYTPHPMAVRPTPARTCNPACRRVAPEHAWTPLPEQKSLKQTNGNGTYERKLWNQIWVLVISQKEKHAIPLSIAATTWDTPTLWECGHNFFVWVFSVTHRGRILFRPTRWMAFLDCFEEKTTVLMWFVLS